MRPTRSLGADVGRLWVGYVGRSLAYLALTLLLTRALGPTGFGELALFIAIAFGVAQVGGAWPFLAIPLLEARSGSIREAFHPAAAVAALGSLVLLAVAIPISILLLGSGDIGSTVALTVYSLALVGLNGVYGILQTTGQMTGIAMVQTLERVAAVVVLLFVGAVTSVTLAGAQYVLAGSALLVATVAFWPLAKRYGLLRRDRGPRSPYSLTTIVKAVGAMGLVGVCAYGVAWLDIYLLELFRGGREVGIYALAYQLYNFVIQLGSLWAVAALPRHSRSSAAGASIASQLPLPRVLALTFTWSAFLVAGACAAALGLGAIFGLDYEEAVAPLLVLLGGAAFAGGYFMISPVLLAGGRTVALAWVAASALAVNLVGDLLLIPPLGLLGPAIATTLQTAVSLFALAWIALGLRSAVRIGGCSVPALVVVSLLATDPQSPVLLGFAAVIALGLFALGVYLPKGRLSGDGEPATEAGQRG